MGKRLLSQHVDKEFEDHHPGCMWGIFHALDYRHWKYIIKKKLSYRKHDRKILALRKGSPKKRLDVCHLGISKNPLVNEASHAFVNQRTTKTGSTTRRSLKARIKALIAEEAPKYVVGKKLGSSISAQPKLQRTSSFHYLEPSNFGLDEICCSGKHPMIVFSNNANDSARKLKDQTQRTPMDQHNMASNRNIKDSFSQNQLNEDYKVSPKRGEDASEISKSQKPNPSKNVPEYQLRDFVDVLDVFKVNKESFFRFAQKKSDMILQKSVSSKSSSRIARLTKPGSFPVANLRPNKLEDKQKEVWSFPRDENSFYHSELTKYVASKLIRNFSTNPGSMMVEDNGDRQQNQHASFDSSSTVEGKNGSLISHGDDDSTCVLSRNNPRYNRASSLSESVERHARLFECSFRRDNYGILKNDASQGASLSGLPISMDSRSISSENGDEHKPTCLPEGAEMFVSVNANEQTERFWNTVERSDSSMRIEYSANLGAGIDDEVTANINGLGDKVFDPVLRTSDCHEEQDFPFTGLSSTKQPQPSQAADLESCSAESRTGTEDIPITEGLEYPDEEQNRSIINSPREAFVIQSSVVEDHFDSNLQKKDEADLNYVREILERSGFIENGFHNKWHSGDQPLDQLVLEQLVKALTPHETECPGKDGNDYSHQQLLFDLVNELLIQIYNGSSSYFLSALSSCRIRPMPVGYCLLEEVWASVSKYNCWKHEWNQTLDGIVGRDLSNDDGWMNLQLDSECVALDLAEMILDEILEEAMCSST